jgi:hypothetical protein
VDPDRVLAAHAIGTCLDPPPPTRRHHCFRIEQLETTIERVGKATLSIGRVEVIRDGTCEGERAGYAALHFGQHDFTCKVSRFEDDGAYEGARERALAAFRGHSLRDTVVTLERDFPGADHDLGDVSVDDRRALMARVLEGTRARAASTHRRLFEDSRRLLEFLADVDIPAPPEMVASAASVAESNLKEVERLLGAASDFDGGLAEFDRVLGLAARLRVPVDRNAVAWLLQGRLDAEARRLDDPGAARRAHDLLHAASRWSFHLRRWRVEVAVERALEEANGRRPDRQLADLRELAAALDLEVP